MTDTNQKLREAFESRMTDNGKWPRAVEQGRNGCYLLAQTENAWAEWQACAEALALPTADHLPDVGEMVNGLTQAETAASASVSGLTAAPVGEREAFEREMSKPPFEFCMARWPDDGSYAWPGNYAAYHTQCAWDAWQARSALSAGDAVDAQRYRWLADCNNYEAGRVLIIDPKLTEQALGAAIDAAMRKDNT